jgi:hypothetical protein
MWNISCHVPIITIYITSITGMHIQAPSGFLVVLCIALKRQGRCAKKETLMEYKSKVLGMPLYTQMIHTYSYIIKICMYMFICFY